jgi:hypothetical protein
MRVAILNRCIQMVDTGDISVVNITQKCKTLYTRFVDDYIRGVEPALSIGWFDVAKLLVFAMLFFIVLGPVMDHAWIYAHNAPASFYTDSDMETINTLYEIFRYTIPIALFIAIVYIVNYSNIKKSE